ncbi:MAG: hypothetical protein J6B68_00645 [Lachnospiraceae bacterium]|nr:hypothetical protein [Lachnospiraceae bacterium]
MVESKFTHVKVNNEIELCEVYDKETKELIKKAFFGAGVSFFIKCKKGFADKEGRYIICVNISQKNAARMAIFRKVDEAEDKVNFFDGSYPVKGGFAPFKSTVIPESTLC